jgi:type IV secretory pathway VirB2 component (pilin)
MAGAREVNRAADSVGDNPAVQVGARVGYAVSGVLHLLIGWIALQVAWQSSGKSADQSGALQTLAANGLGRFTLWVAVVGFLALGLFQLANGLAVRPAPGSSPWVHRAKSLSKGVVYLALAWTCFSFAKGKPSSSKAQSADFTATLLQKPGGQLLVAVLGLAVIGVGIYHVAKGWTKKFLQDLAENPGVLVTRLGEVGYIAKGFALAVVGILFVAAAAQNSASKATGLDGALRSMRQQPAGSWLLTAVALGIAAYGVYSFARARFARV